MERRRQLPLPSDDFAPEGVRQFIVENPDVSKPMRLLLEDTAHIVTHPSEYKSHEVEGARAFYGIYFFNR